METLGFAALGLAVLGEHRSPDAARAGRVLPGDPRQAVFWSSPRCSNAALS
jgi:hypothetical protein